MINRRLLLSSALVLPLAACNSMSFNQFSTALYTDVKVVAKLLESAAKKSVTNLQGAINDMMPYVVPCCRLIVSMSTLLNQLLTGGQLSMSNSKVATAKQVLDGLSGNQFISSTASTGILPNASDALMIITAIIQGTALVMQLVPKVTPTAAA